MCFLASKMLLGFLFVFEGFSFLKKSFYSSFGGVLEGPKVNPLSLPDLIFMIVKKNNTIFPHTKTGTRLPSLLLQGRLVEWAKGCHTDNLPRAQHSLLATPQVVSLKESYHPLPQEESLQTLPRTSWQHNAHPLEWNILKQPFTVMNRYKTIMMI